MTTSSSIIFLIDSHPDGDNDDLQPFRRVANLFETQVILLSEWASLSDSQKDLRQYSTLILGVQEGSLTTDFSHLSLDPKKKANDSSALLSWLCDHEDYLCSHQFLIITDSNQNQRAADLCSYLHQRKSLMLSNHVVAYHDDLSSLVSQLIPPTNTPVSFDGTDPSLKAKKKPSAAALVAARRRLASRSSSTTSMTSTVMTPSSSIASVPSISVMNTSHTVKVVAVRQLLKKPSPMASTVQVVLDLNGVALHHRTADNIGVHPRNDEGTVDRLCEHLGCDPDESVTMKQLKTLPLSMTCSVRDALLWRLDLMSPPRKHFIKFLAAYAEDADEVKQLEELARVAGRRDLLAEQLSLIELLEKFPSVRPPLQNFLQECPRLQPRIFTIASSALAHPHQLHLLVSLDRITKAGDRIHNGVCSTYLTNLIPGQDTCHIFLRKSSFFVPDDRPVVMLGTGAGIAPFRALIQEVVHRHITEGVSFPDWHLFFGCRRREDDFIYEEELLHAESLGVLKGLYLAFSRSDPDKKVYIQDRMKEQQELLWNLINRSNAVFFICGSTRMGKGVVSRLRDIVSSNTGYPADKADQYLKRLSEDGRLISELWG